MTGYLGLGSNLGDRQATLTRAIQLVNDDATEVAEVSSLYETGHVGPEGETAPPYLNCVVRVETALDPLRLLRTVQAVEDALGRARPYANAPRTVDIDILLLDDLVLDLLDLRLPHPRMWDRRFVLEPLAEIAPRLELPDGGRIEELLHTPAIAGQPVLLYRRRASDASIAACDMRMWQD